MGTLKAKLMDQRIIYIYIYVYTHIRDYIGVAFPYSLLRTGKMRVCPWYIQKCNMPSWQDPLKKWPRDARRESLALLHGRSSGHP